MKTKYPIGTKFWQWKFVDLPEYVVHIDNNYKVECIIDGFLYWNDELGAIYTATPKEAVECMDSNWGKSMENSTYVSDMELDKGNILL